MPIPFRLATLALCLASAFAQAAPDPYDTWQGSGPITDGSPSLIINALAVSPDGRTVYAGGQSGKVFKYVHAPLLGSNANLTELNLSAGTLSPAFASDTFAYAASVANSASTLTITPTRADSNATISVNGQATTTAVALNVGSNTLSIVVTAENTSNTRTYTLTVTRAAAAPPISEPDTPPTQPPSLPPITGGETTVPSGGTTTVTGPAQVTASPGSTVNLSGPSVVGATLALPPTPAGQPVSVTIGGRTVSISNPGSSPASFTVQSITAADGSVQTVLVVTPPATGSAPSVTLTSTAAAGQVLVAFALPGTSGRRLEVVSQGGPTGVTIGSTSSGTPGVTGGYNISLSSGSATVPITRRPSRSARVRSALDTVTIHAGERAFFDSEGYFESLRLGTASGDGAGDALTLSLPDSLRFTGAIPRLDAPVHRLGKTLQQAVADAAGARLVDTQQQGILSLDLDGQRLYLLPLGTVDIESARADGVSFDTAGNALVTQAGVTVRLAPSAVDPVRLAEDIVAALPGATVKVTDRGLVTVTTTSGLTYVLRPDWIAPQADAYPDGFANDAAGRLSYVQKFHRFVLYPAFADFEALLATVQQAVPGATVTSNPDGTVTVRAGENRWTLTPAYTSEAAPTAQPVWWGDGTGRFWLKGRDGTMQEFRIE